MCLCGRNSLQINDLEVHIWGLDLFATKLYNPNPNPNPLLKSPFIVIIVHCGSTRQTASIISMNQENLRTGDKASCRFRFIKNPEYIRQDTRMVFREGRTKAVGNITKTHPYIPGSAQQSMKQKSMYHLHHGAGHGRNKGRRGRRKTASAATAAAASGTGSSTMSQIIEGKKTTALDAAVTSQ